MLIDAGAGARMWMDDFRRRTRWNAYANGRQYTAPADPFALVRVNPAAVDAYKTASLKWGLGRVRGSAWDRPENCEPIDDLYIYTGLVERFETGADWEETVYYERVAEEVEAGGFRGCESVEAIEDTVLPALEDLYDDMRENGYRPNRGVVYEDVEDFDYIHDLEPLVLIGRHGEIIWSEGFHRFALARILGVEDVPVYVLRRHAQWQRIRDRVARGRLNGRHVEVVDSDITMWARSGWEAGPRRGVQQGFLKTYSEPILGSWRPADDCRTCEMP